MYNRKTWSLGFRVSRTCASENRVDLAQHLGCVQMTRISTKKSIASYLNSSCVGEYFHFLHCHLASHAVLLKTNEFVKQISILPTFSFFIIVIFEIFFVEARLQTILIICCYVQQFDSVRSTYVSNNTCPH